MTSTYTVVLSAEQNPVWVCFEPWGTEHIFPPNTTVVLRFGDTEQLEQTHHADGITFFSTGKHPDIYSKDGELIELYSDGMPEFAADMVNDVLRFVIQATPPRGGTGHGRADN